MIIAAIILSVVMPSERLVDAVAHTESMSDNYAVGDRGRAIGAWQIWECAWDTANDYRELNGLVRIDRNSANPEKHREIARWLLAWHIYRLRVNGVSNPTDQQVYLSFAMGVKGFSRIGFNPKRVGRTHRRALIRLNNYLRDN